MAMQVCFAKLSLQGEIDSMFKLLLPFFALMMLSMTGCCEYFGLCASASVHTSIPGSVQYAQNDSNATPGPAELAMIAPAPSQPSTCSN